VVVPSVLQWHMGEGGCFYDITFKIPSQKPRGSTIAAHKFAHTTYSTTLARRQWTLQYSNKDRYGPIECSSFGSMLYDNYYPDAHTLSFVSDLQLANLVHIDLSPTPLNPFIAANDFDLSVPPSTDSYTHTHTSLTYTIRSLNAHTSLTN